MSGPRITYRTAAMAKNADENLSTYIANCQLWSDAWSWESTYRILRIFPHATSAESNLTLWEAYKDNRAMFIPERSQDAKFRTLIVLLDGTGDSVDADVTNIVRFKRMLYGSEKEDKKQMVLYLRGIGSPMDGYDPQFAVETVHSCKTWIHRTWDQAFAAHFSEYVITPYEWLAQNYRDGDKICIFGFSRGAYTARVVAGMINAIGLLPKEHANKAGVKAAYDIYDDFADLPRHGSDEVREAAWLALSTRFQSFKVEKKSREVLIEFLGCWDTVNSVGYIRAIRLGFTRTNDIVRTFRHAISLDEHRVKFKQSNWSGPPKEIPDSSDRPNDKTPRVITDVEEVWFAGCHCDIGGGSVPNGTRPNLSHISLRWMIRECMKMNSGIMFDLQAIKVIGITIDNIHPIVKPRPAISSPPGPAKIAVVKRKRWMAYLTSWLFFTSKKVTKLKVPDHTEEELDTIDALAPLYDQLALKPGKWALMEHLPMAIDILTTDRGWEEVKEQHLSHGRTMPPPTVVHGGKIKVHRTVKIRMGGKFESGEKVGKTYVPLARVGYEHKYEDKTPFIKALERGWIEWVD